MKGAFFFSILLVTFLSTSCKKEAEQGIKKVEIDASLTPVTEFRLELKQYIQEHEFPLITKPPDKSLVSKILYSDRTSGPVYQYVTDLPAGSTDKVIIKIIREHDHSPEELEHDAEQHEDNDDYTSVIITINFTIR